MATTTDQPTTHAEPDDLLTRYAAALHELAAMANEDPSGPFADLVRWILAGKRWHAEQRWHADPRLATGGLWL